MSNATFNKFAVREDLIPGCWVWQSPLNQQWHARVKGSQPPKLFQAESLEELRDEVDQA